MSRLISAIRRDTEGGVLVLMALLLPVLLLLGSVVLEGSQLYIRQAELQHLSQAGADSGMIEVGRLLKDQAQENYHLECEGETPPSFCEGGSLFDFLEDHELETLFQDPHTRALIAQNIQDFVTSSDPDKALQPAEVTVDFPHEYVLGSDQVLVQVVIESAVPRFFEPLRGVSKMRVQALSSISLE